MTRVLSLVCLISALWPVRVRAQQYEDIGLRAQGMAGAFVAVADDATATWWNPAGLPTGGLFSAILEFDDNGGRGIAAAIPQFGLSYYRTQISEIRRFDSTAAPAGGRQDPGAVGTGLSASEPVSVHQFGATFGQSIGAHLVVASTLKLVHAGSDTRGDLDLGAMATFGAVRAGVSVRNVNTPTFGDAFEMPLRARAGAALTGPGRGGVSHLTLGFDVDLIRATVGGHEEQRLAGGFEAVLLNRRVGVRAGMGMDTANEDATYVGAGLSVAVRSGIYVDAAVTLAERDVEDRWGVGVRVAF